MISLYPSHIPIFSHIHIFHIFLCSYFYRFRWLPCHLFFFISRFYGVGNGVCFSCGFSVPILWRVFAPFPRSVLRSVSPLGSLLVPPFATLFGLLFGSPHRFVFPFGRVGRAVRGSRRFVQLVGADGCLCSFVSWCRGSDGGRIVERVGSADGVACRLCGAYSVPCGGAWGGA